MYGRFIEAGPFRTASLEASCHMITVDPLRPYVQAIEMAGMRTTTAYEEVKAGRLAIIKNGRRTFVRASELQRYIDSLSA